MDERFDIPSRRGLYFKRSGVRVHQSQLTIVLPPRIKRRCAVCHRMNSRRSYSNDFLSLQRSKDLAWNGDEWLLFPQSRRQSVAQLAPGVDSPSKDLSFGRYGHTMVQAESSSYNFLTCKPSSFNADIIEPRRFITGTKSATWAETAHE